MSRLHKDTPQAFVNLFVVSSHGDVLDIVFAEREINDEVFPRQRLFMLKSDARALARLLTNFLKNEKKEPDQSISK